MVVISMPTPPHIERHFQAPAVVRDVVIGMADGLTVPFALAAGLSGTGQGTNIVVIAGLAEIAAGSIAMGLGGYLAGKTDIDHYRSELAREYRECEETPEEEVAEVERVFRQYGVPENRLEPVVNGVTGDPRRWVDFMMKFELGLEEPDPRRARSSALAIGLSYIAGGLVPLAPYMALESLSDALAISVAMTLAALFVFGWFKGRFTGVPPLRGGLQTLLMGGLASGAAYGIARLIG